jgi:hypothetical protein
MTLVVLMTYGPYTLAGTLNLALPQQSDHRIVLHGAVGDNRGIAGMVPQTAPSHLVTSLNCRPVGSYSYRYLVGREHAEYTHTAVWYAPWGCYVKNTPVVNNATESAIGTDVQGMPQTAAFLAGQGQSLASLAFRVGQRAGRSIRDTWSLDPDVLNQDYYCDPADTVEERLYKGDGTKLLASFSYQGVVVLEFAYSPLKMILNYRTTLINDDLVLAYSHPVGYTIPPGLVGNALALATALDADIQAAGGCVQLRLDTIQTTSRTDFVADNASLDVYGIFTFTGSFMAVPGIPRPVLNLQLVPPNVLLSWDSANNVLYHLESRDTLSVGGWGPVGGVRVGNGLQLQTPVPLEAAQFFQLQAEPQ